MKPAVRLIVVFLATLVPEIVLRLDEILLLGEFIQILAKILCNYGHFVLYLVTLRNGMVGELGRILKQFPATLIAGGLSVVRIARSIELVLFTCSLR